MLSAEVEPADTSLLSSERPLLNLGEGGLSVLAEVVKIVLAWTGLGNGPSSLLP